MLRPAYIFLWLFFGSAVAPVLGQVGIPDKIGGNTNRGPSLSAIKKKADKGAERGDYSQAVHYYRLLWQRDSTDGEALNKLGEAALANTQDSLAIWAFQTLLNQGLTKDAGHTMVRLAFAYYCLGDYDEAERRYQQVATVVNASKESKEEAEKGLDYCAWAKGVAGSENTKLSNLVQNLNTRYAEYAPVRVDNTLYYTSYSKPLNGDSSRMLMQILAATPAGTQMQAQSADMNAEKKHTAYLAFNEDRSVQYFARGDYEKESNIEFQLYRRKLIGQDAWGPEEKLPAYINLEDVTTTQPNIGRLPGDTVETLFFVSDRSGGSGKKDIWYARILKDSFAAPQNLKTVNTDGDDVSPFYFSGDSTLYFSSNSNTQISLGGFDIYRSKWTASGWKTPGPMPPPFNSGANDVFFSISEACNMRFFASNRGGNLNYSEEECCYNLYSTDKNLEIRIDVFHEITRAPLEQTNMRLMEKTAFGMTEISSAAVPGYSYTFPLSANKNYTLIVNKPGFNSKTITFNSNDEGWGTCLKELCYLKPIKIDLDVYVFDADTKEPVPGPDIYFYDLSYRKPDGSTQTGAAGSPLDSVVQLNHPKHFAHYDLKPDHEYRMMATKPGFTSDSEEASTIGITRDTTLRRDLYIQRGLQYTVRVFDEFTKKPLDSIAFVLSESRIDNTGDEKSYDYFSGNNNNEFNQTIFYDRRYTISASKAGYWGDDNSSSASKGRRTDTLGLEKVPFQHLYDTLYLRRISLPIVLYYDNDVPDQGMLNTDLSTDWLYAGTYVKYTDKIRFPDFPDSKRKYNGVGYFERKQKYLNECCANMAKTDPEYIAMNTFFDSLVQGEWLRLRAFREYLTEKLRSGECWTVTIEGYASPLGNIAYNERLTHRRVDCLLNHLQRFEGATDIAEYYKQGRFVIIPVYNGSEESRQLRVPEKGTKAIYSVEAAKARRVIISKMEPFKCDAPLSGTQPGAQK